MLLMVLWPILSEEPLTIFFWLQPATLLADDKPNYNQPNTIFALHAVSGAAANQRAH